MATKYLSNLYSYKYIPERFVSKGGSSPAESHGDALEGQIQTRLTQGHDHFFHGRYADALEAYQAAYALIHRFLHPDFPDRIVSIHPSMVQKLDIFDHVLAAAGETARFRKVGGDRLPIVSPVDPPPEIMKIVEQFGTDARGGPPAPAQHYYRMATTYLQLGATSEAQRFVDLALKFNQGHDAQLEADAYLASGAVLMQQNKSQEAQGVFSKAQGLYTKLGLQHEVAVVNNNLGVLHTLSGDAAAAGRAFQMAGDQLPLDLGRTLAQPLNPGTASAMVRPMGSQGLGLILRAPESESGWLAISAAAPGGEVGAERLRVLVNDQVVDIDLKADAVTEFKQRIYESRVSATRLEELHTHEDLASNFVAYMGQAYGFTLPMSMGDCYFEMGEYDKALSWYTTARDYAYLNQPIEAPQVWLKMANAYLNWGHFLLESHEKAEARARYEKIVRLTAPALDPASDLYLSPVFDGVKAQVEAILAAYPSLDGAVHNPAIANFVLVARLNLQNIQSGIDLPLLSLNREEVPVFSFEYLQSTARYFAEHAIQAERTYINFKTSAEQEEFSRSMLENAVDLERANETLEQKKVQIAAEQKGVVDANVALAQTQLDNATAAKTEYASVSLQEISLDSEITYVGAPTTEYDFSGYGGYGISDGEHRVDEVLRTLTRRRQEISRGFELDNMDRRISELDAARKVAQQQQVVAQSQLEAAALQSQIAALRRQQAEQQLALFDSQEFTPDLWNRLANEIKAISQNYLGQAIVIAQLMEQAYEFEVGEAVDIIKPNYTRNDLSGLLAGDFLLKDIDTFTFLRITLAQKTQPVKEVISLADRYPVQFLREFQRTGQMNFRTELSDFDLNFPGGYQRRIKRVEVVVEGLIGRGGIHGTLTNTGLCLTRVRNGDVKMRLLKPETLLLSQYRIGPDSVVFIPDREMLAIFENSPVCSSWVLELRPSVNDLIYNFITDVKLVLYYESFFDPDLKGLVLEELAETQAITGRRTVALRYELFDEFFAFQDTGEVRFALRETMLPFYHTQPTIREMTILVQTDDGVSPAGLVVQVAAADGTLATQTTDADGAISSGSGASLNVLLGQPWTQEWRIAIPQPQNQARFDAGFNWSQVRNIVLVSEYSFTPRPIAGEPYLLLRDGFDHDPMAAFEVVDDPQAVQDAPSNWSYNAASQLIQQTSNIHAPAAPANMNSDPDKPGTYLVRKTDAGLPEVKDLLFTCRVCSTDNNGVGLVFRWQDVDNFYFFLMDSQRNYRRMGKKVGGVFQELSAAALDATQGYVVGQSYAVKVRVKGESFQLYLDGDLALEGQDAASPHAGRVGLFAWGNTGAQFDDMQVIEI